MKRYIVLPGIKPNGRVTKWGLLRSQLARERNNAWRAKLSPYMLGLIEKREIRELEAAQKELGSQLRFEDIMAR